MIESASVNASTQVEDNALGVYYMEYAGLEILVDLYIASPFSWHKAIGNAGPALALESMGAKPTFRCHSLKKGLMYIQSARTSFVYASESKKGLSYLACEYPPDDRAGKPLFDAVGLHAYSPKGM